MRALKLVSAVIAVLVVTAPTAGADLRRVDRSESLRNPAFAGTDVVYTALGRRDQIEVRRVTPDGAVSVIGNFPKTAEFQGAAVAGSSTHVAAAALFMPGTDAFRYTEALAAGPLLGPLTALDFHCPGEQNNVPSHDADQPIALDGTRLAYVRETCTNADRRREVVIRDLATGAEFGHMLTNGVGVALAGRFVAYLAPGTEEALNVFDLERGAVIYSVPAQKLLAFDLQDDGKLVVSQYGDSACEGEVSWHSPADPASHWLGGNDCSELPPVAIERDRVVYQVDGRFRVHDLGGGTARLAVGSNIDGEDSVPGFDGERIAFATRGCSRDTGSVWTVGVSDTSVRPPRPPRCRAIFARGPLRMDAKRRIPMRVACPAGCRGFVSVEAGDGRGPLIAHADFELRAGQSRRLRLGVRRRSRVLQGRSRSMPVRVNVSIDKVTDSLGEYRYRTVLTR